jgi:acyl carrier protein
MTQRLSREAVASVVSAAWNAALPNASVDDGFFNQGGDSLAAIRFVSHLEKELGVRVPFGKLVTVAGVNDIVSWICSDRQ